MCALYSLHCTLKTVQCTSNEWLSDNKSEKEKEPVMRLWYSKYSEWIRTVVNFVNEQNDKTKRKGEKKTIFPKKKDVKTKEETEN